MKGKNRAVFFKRDGVLNELIFNIASGHYEAPLKEENLKIYPGVIKSLKALRAKEIKIFIISHQPAFALGQISKEELLTIEETFKRFLIINNVNPTGIYYCHHHPHGTVQGYSGACPCSPPSPFFLIKAIEKYQLDPAQSWVVGNTELEVKMGNAAKIRTLLQKNKLSKQKCGKLKPEKVSEHIEESVQIILDEMEKKGVPLQMPPTPYNPRFPLMK